MCRQMDVTSRCDVVARRARFLGGVSARTASGTAAEAEEDASSMNLSAAPGDANLDAVSSRPEIDTPIADERRDFSCARKRVSVRRASVGPALALKPAAGEFSLLLFAPTP
jgi:hypothetical protein